ncbi:tspB [Penicillium waksmanii]|uniref:tspB n=1 Tax=Penicillium waksmanii TaxID=69791 RepID=UPI0025495C81|nr:tspB [Penicillium waksmanii]KAJ5963171.1 tspB [Penicillium waksmanii]
MRNTMTDDKPSSKQRVIIASNRLPLSIDKYDGNYRVTPSSGGLVTALRGLSVANYLWLGWPGIEIGETEREEVYAVLAKENAAAVYLSDEMAQNHYNGFSNEILWPILHYQSGAHMNFEAWTAYQQVNEVFADRISEEAKDGDLIWIHDYHLLLLPSMLRERLKSQNKCCPIGFFLHTPFPVDDFWRGLPVQGDLLRGVLGSDIIGFHTDEYMKNFIGACKTLIGADVMEHSVQYDNHTVRLDKYFVGIDPQKFSDALNDQAIISRTQELESLYKGKTIIIGVDRLDYTKGLPEKFLGFQVFLDEHPEWAEKIVLVQIVIPSREDVARYKDLKDEISKLAGQIIGKYVGMYTDRLATPHSTPLLYIHRSVSFEELIALYSISDVCLISSHRDGLNLVASEYVSCQEKRHGVLVLSEFTGAATFMKGGSLLINPSDTRTISHMLYKALTMENEERKANYEELRDFVNTHTSVKWTETFLNELYQLGNSN